MKGSLLLLGAGGHGRVVADAALAMGAWQGVMFLDPAPPLHYPWPVARDDGDLTPWLLTCPEALVSLGDNVRRLRELARLEQAGLRVATLVHPGSLLGSRVELAPGTVVLAGAMLNADVHVGPGCILNTGCIVEHECRLDAGVHVSPGAVLGGGVQVAARAWIGLGARVIPGCRIGGDAVIGAGAVVIGDIPAGMVAVGVPARVVHAVADMKPSPSCNLGVCNEG
ncbi:MAG: acetyltransferase [Magnetococcus sp. WYHC-3]